MNFEELERTTSEHIVRHYLDEPLNQDYTYHWCYPPLQLKLFLIALIISGTGLDENIKQIPLLQELPSPLIYLNNLVVLLNLNIVTLV